MNLLSVESFSDTFGSKRKRKRPKLSGAVSCLASLVKDAQSKTGNYRQDKDYDAKRAAGLLGQEKEIKSADIFMKGQSKRIWEELHKVIDCSDVVVQVLDARDPMGTRSQAVETHIRKEKAHKHLVFVLKYTNS